MSSFTVHTVCIDCVRTACLYDTVMQSILSMTKSTYQCSTVLLLSLVGERIVNHWSALGEVTVFFWKF